MSPVRFRIVSALLVGVLVLAAAAPTAGARKARGSASTPIPERYVAIDGPRGAGPERFDRVFVNEIGPPEASRVLVLVPGFIGGAGDFRLIGRDIVSRVPDLQVWAVDRRSNALEDTSVFAGGDPDKAFAYYLNFQPVDGRQFQPLNGQDFPYARQWGLDLALRDLRRVILAARAEGARKVILGGHSLGASTAVAYSTWDFDRRPGYKDIDGVVLIDGGLKGTFTSPTFKEVQQRFQALETGDPFVDLIGLGLPWAAGVFAESAALYGLKKPNEPSVLQQYPPIPPQFKAPVRTTNEAALGYAFDESTSPPGFELIRVRADSWRPAATLARGRTARSRQSSGWPRHSPPSPATESSGTSRSACRWMSMAPTSSSETGSRTSSGCAPGIRPRRSCRYMPSKPISQAARCCEGRGASSMRRRSSGQPWSRTTTCLTSIHSLRLRTGTPSCRPFCPS